MRLPESVLEICEDRRRSRMLSPAIQVGFGCGSSLNFYCQSHSCRRYGGMPNVHLQGQEVVATHMSWNRLHDSDPEPADMDRQSRFCYPIAVTASTDSLDGPSSGMMRCISFHCLLYLFDPHCQVSYYRSGGTCCASANSNIEIEQRSIEWRCRHPTRSRCSTFQYRLQ